MVFDLQPPYESLSNFWHQKLQYTSPTVWLVDIKPLLTNHSSPFPLQFFHHPLPIPAHRAHQKGPISSSQVTQHRPTLVEAKAFAIQMLQAQCVLMYLQQNSEKTHQTVGYINSCYILPIGWLYITYHLLREPETAVGYIVDSVFSIKSCTTFFESNFFDGPFREATPATSQPLAQRNCPVAKSVSSNCGQNNDFEQKSLFQTGSIESIESIDIYWDLLNSIDRKPTAEAVPGDLALSCLAFGWIGVKATSRAYRMTLAWHWAKFAKTNHTVCNVTDDTIPQLWKVDMENCSWFHHFHSCSIWTRAA